MFVGISFLIAVIVMFTMFRDFSQTAVNVPAQISAIESYRDSKGRLEHRAYVTYEYDGNRYEDVPLNSYSSNMYKGMPITVLCDPQNPSKIQEPGGAAILFAIFGGMGSLFVVIGIVPIVREVKKRKLSENLKEGGVRLTAYVDEISLNRSFQMNGRHPYLVFCSYSAPDGKIYRFKSANIWSNPNLVLNVGSPVDVYTDAKDYSKYYVDVQSLIDGKIVDLT